VRQLFWPELPSTQCDKDDPIFYLFFFFFSFSSFSPFPKNANPPCMFGALFRSFFRDSLTTARFRKKRRMSSQICQPQPIIIVSRDLNFLVIFNIEYFPFELLLLLGVRNPFELTRCGSSYQGYAVISVSWLR